MTSHQEILVQNQQTLRAANERFGNMVEQRADGRRVPFLCECPDLDCRERIEMTMSDYEAIHILRSQYILLPGHRMAEGETVQDLDGDGYVVAQK